MVLRPDKCRLGLHQVEYLGFIVDGDGVLMAPARVAALQAAQPPTLRLELKAFYGLAN